MLLEVRDLDVALWPRPRRHGVSLERRRGRDRRRAGRQRRRQSSLLGALLGVVKPRAGTSSSTAPTSPAGRRAAGRRGPRAGAGRPAHPGQPDRARKSADGRVLPPRRHGRRSARSTGSMSAFPIWRRAAHSRPRCCRAASSRCWRSAARCWPAPKLMMLDEPSLGLSPKLSDELFALHRRAQPRAGMSILLVEQNTQSALEIADRAYVLELGRVVMRRASREAALRTGAAASVSRPRQRQRPHRPSGCRAVNERTD